MKTLYSSPDVDGHEVVLNYGRGNFWLTVDGEPSENNLPPPKVVEYNHLTTTSIVFFVLSAILWAAMIHQFPTP